MTLRQFKRPPLRTFQELCEEHKTTPQRMARLLADHADTAPKPAFVRHGYQKSTWYEPGQFRVWFQSIQK